VSPYLNVGGAAMLPDFATRFTVVRRQSVVDAQGWNAPVAVNVRALGTITNASPNDLLRLPEDMRQQKTISIVTTFALRSASKDALGAAWSPDLVLYQGDYFAIVDIDDLTGFGGQVQALAQMTDYTPSAPGTAN